MTEIEKLDNIIDHLCEHKSQIIHYHISKILGVKTSEEEARYLFSKLIEDKVVQRIHAGNNDEVLCIDYTYQTQLIRDNGGYKELELKRGKIEAEKSKLKDIEKNKLIKEAKLADWQVKIFWPLFIIALIGGLCGVISLLIQIINKP